MCGLRISVTPWVDDVCRMRAVPARLFRFFAMSGDCRPRKGGRLAGCRFFFAYKDFKIIMFALSTPEVSNEAR